MPVHTRGGECSLKESQIMQEPELLTLANVYSERSRNVEY